MQQISESLYLMIINKKSSYMISKINSSKILKIETIITLLIGCLGLGCSTDKTTIQEEQKPDKINLIVKDSDIRKKDDSFDIILQMNKINDEHYSLSATIELNSGSYVISPYSTDDFYLPFTMVMNESPALVVQGDLMETPVSVEEQDPYLNKPIRVVRKNTTYTQNLKVVSKDDFEASGLIEFLLEPSCVPYDVEFNISSNDGELEVQKTKTFISKEYKL